MVVDQGEANKVNLEALVTDPAADQETGVVADQVKQDEPAAVDPADVDTLALLEAQEEVLKEKSPDKVDAADTTNADITKVETKADDQAPEGTEGKPVVPVERLNQEIRKTNELERRLQDLEARVKAGPVPAKQTVPDITIADLDAALVKLGQDFNAGAVDAEEFTKLNAKLIDQRVSIMVGAMISRATSEATTKDIRMAEVTDQLVREHPYVNHLTLEDGKFLESKAVAQLAAAGVTIPSVNRSPREVLMVRAKVAELSDTFGPVLTGKSPEDVGIKKPAAPTNSNQQTIDEVARARQVKLDLARQIPPDISKMSGRVDDGTNTPSAAELENLSEDEIGALPESIRKKISSGSF